MALKNLKNKVLLNAKNLVGWRTKRKIVVFSVDDYGNVRLNSSEARRNLDREGLKVNNRFDSLDTLETREDLEQLFKTLKTVTDKNGRHPVFTAFAMPCNINFEKVAENGFRQYYYERLPVTFEKLTDLQPEVYKDTWAFWKNGMKQGLLVPQFHGREHLNLNLFEEKLAKKDPKLLAALRNRSYTSISSGEYSTVSATAAFDFWDIDENNRYKEIIKDGLHQFESVFGYRAVHFTPPVYNVHPELYPVLSENGIRYIDTALVKKEHQGKGVYKTKINYTGKKSCVDQVFVVRNIVFEPVEKRSVDWVDFAIEQIKAAFRWNRPAIISSHRVNFCGHIDPDNRRKGLEALRELLKQITKRWPEVEFMAAHEVGELILNDKKD